MNTIRNQFILGQKFLFDSDNNLLTDQTSQASDPVRLGSNESRILKLLVERPNQIVTRNELHEYVWRDQGFEVDDSSLTQAISTLRKMLQDPTKSPQFVRTVPKRGYQLISSVENVENVDILPSEDVTDEPKKPTPQPNIEPEVIVEEPVSEVIQPSTSNDEIKKPKTSSNTWLIVAVAIILPLFAYFSTPKEEAFKHISTLDNVEILTPANHTDITPWLSKVDQCVTNYIDAHQSEAKPVKAIVTGESTGQISINFIHNIAHSSENSTIRIFGAQQDLAIKCE
ncbi:winged helix-turn-helix domain-containing protein [Vibrio hippocampi]|uniref:OmpR/PhoB-type domain-containing protein n=1 Tax=Vibrio hippocampi TaxID=654686 RepID=A0ABN8DJ04_9VIBR|nr:transcriptional regulator [Vibrio hippocampi]CAH0526755.1 hypothetical protein VHP8226_02127 [Vibrio hippocampi]